MAELSEHKLDIPTEDAWIIGRLVRLMAQRLVHGVDDATVRGSLMRALYALQRLPIMVPGSNLSIGAGSIHLELSPERCGLSTFSTDGDTVLQLQYFDTAHHCLDSNHSLTGDDKRLRLEGILERLELAFVDGVLDVEDLSSGSHVDEPPLNGCLEHALSWKDS